jgi:hypothetical protein
MTCRNLVKLGLAAMFLAATALPARAGLVTVNEVDAENIAYTATVTPLGGGAGILQIAYNGANEITTINGNLISPFLNALWTGVAFPDMNPSTNVYTTAFQATPILGGGGAVSVTGLTVGPLGAAGGDIGIQDDTGVVLNYQPNIGNTSTPGATESLSLTGAVNIDTANFPGNPTTYTSGGNTYDFSPFLPGSSYLTSITITLASSEDLIDALLSGTPSTFTGNASVTLVAMAVPEPASVTLLCMGGMVCGFAGIRRRRKA